MRHGIIFLWFFILANTVFGQIDSIHSKIGFFSFSGGVSSSVDEWQNNSRVTDGIQVVEGTPYPVIPGWAFAINYSSTNSKHYLFQTGIEYVMARYYFTHLYAVWNAADNFYKKDYMNIYITVHSITIPSYFNLFLAKRRFFMGIGPNLDFFPYVSASGNVGSAQYVLDHGTYYAKFPEETIKNVQVPTISINIGISAKIGGIFRIGKSQLIMEARIKQGAFNLFKGYGFNRGGYVDKAGQLNGCYGVITLGYILRSWNR